MPGKQVWPKRLGDDLMQFCLVGWQRQPQGRWCDERQPRQRVSDRSQEQAADMDVQRPAI